MSDTPEWWTLFSRTLGAMLLQDIRREQDETPHGRLAMSGAGYVYYDEGDAKTAETALRETWPRLDIVAVPLSSVMQHRPNDEYTRRPKQLMGQQATYLYGTEEQLAVDTPQALIVLDVRVSTGAPQHAQQVALQVMERARRAVGTHPMLRESDMLTISVGIDDAQERAA